MRLLFLIPLFFTAFLNAQMDTTSYSIGMVIAENLKAQGISDLDKKSFLTAIEDVLEGNKTAVTLSEANRNFQAFAEEARRKVSEANKTAGETYLAENKDKPGVVTTSSGLQYKILERAEGSVTNPTATNKVRVHYHGTLIDGTVFDSSVERGEPISFPVNGVIQGWQEGLQLMTVGSKFRFYIPYNLAYGDRAAGADIKPYSALIFDVTLLEIQ